MTNSGLAEIDALIHEAMTGAGIADSGTYRVGGVGAGTPDVRAYVNRSPQQMTAGGEVVVLHGAALVDFLKADLTAAPKNGDTFTVGAEVFKVDRLNEHDESMWRTLCR